MFKKIVIGLLIIVIVAVLGALAIGPESILLRISSLMLPAYPETDQAPTLELTWDGEIPLQSLTRYTPYGIWENKEQTPQGVAYEPAQEMQFYFKEGSDNLLAVAPGTITFISPTQVYIRYGKNYSLIYYHMTPDKNLKIGQKVETGQYLGKMERNQNQHLGEEIWWEIGLTKYDPQTKLVRSVAPYDYFSLESKKKLDEIIQVVKERYPNFTEAPSWTVTTGCSWIEDTGSPEWWANYGRLGYMPQGAINQSLEDFIKSINPHWKVVEPKGLIIGPTDECGY